MTETQRPIEHPHLETDVDFLFNFPHPDLMSESVTLDVNVSRYGSEPEPFIFVSERDEGTLLRMPVADARRLTDALERAILAAELQAKVDLQEPLME